MAVPSPGMRLRARPGHPDFLDLPWEQPLEDWTTDRIVEVARGEHRHVVRFVDYDGVLYALKEMPRRLAEREYRMLRRLGEEEMPVVQVVGVVNRGGGLADVLVTRYLDFSLPYRLLFTHRRASTQDVRGLSDPLLDGLVMLLVRLHLIGFYWGDCSLNNVLFRRDAGALAAYLVDAETAEWHDRLTDGQREADLDITVLNVAGGLMDVAAQLDLTDGPDPVETADDLRARYAALWAELTTSELIGPDEHYRIDARLRRLNDLGFDVDEIDLVATPGGDRLELRTLVAEAGHHRRHLLSLTGLEAQENQARSLLNDMANFRAYQERLTGRPLPRSVAAYRWLLEVFEPTVAAIPQSLRGKLEPVEVFHEVIEHKWFLSEAAGRDVGVEEAAESYMNTVLPEAPDELRILHDQAEGWIGYG